MCELCGPAPTKAPVATATAATTIVLSDVAMNRPLQPDTAVVFFGTTLHDDMASRAPRRDEPRHARPSPSQTARAAS